jgi:hypothetical protein
MNNQDDQLHRFLQQWKDIEPSADFDARVRRRIPEPQPTFADWLCGWLPRPAFALGAAAVVGAVIGVAGGWFSVAPASGFGLLGPDTLAGSYIRMAQR